MKITIFISMLCLVISSASAQTISEVRRMVSDSANIEKNKVLVQDLVNNNATANTLQDGGLSFDVVSGNTYKFKFYVTYTTAVSTTGARFTISGPAVSNLSYRSQYSLSSTSETVNSGLGAYNLPAASNASAVVAGSTAIVEGLIKPSVNGTVILRFASEVLSSAITIKANSSYVEYRKIN